MSGSGIEAAFYRKTAAEMVQRYPEVVEPLRDGRLCITAVVELARVITPDNTAEVLSRFFHRSTQEAKVISAEMAPSVDPPRRTVVTASPPAARSLDLGQVVQRLNSPSVSASENSTATFNLVRPDEETPPRPPFRDTAEPLTADLRRLHLTVSKRFLEKLEAARMALSHSHPGATTEAVLEAALDLVLAKDAKKKGLVSKPRPAPASAPPPGKRYVPAAVRREVWKRDGGRCQFPLATGGICGSTVRVEIDHIRPVAQGGRSTVGNTRLACDIHNDAAARHAFGDALMDLYTRRKKAAGDG